MLRVNSRQLSKENKKFAYATVRPNGRGRDYQGSLQWIEDAGIIRRSFLLENRVTTLLE